MVCMQWTRYFDESVSSMIDIQIRKILCGTVRTTVVSRDISFVVVKRLILSGLRINYVWRFIPVDLHFQRMRV